MCACRCQNHPRGRLAATTWGIFFVRAVVDFGDFGASCCQLLTQPLMYQVQFENRQQPFGYTPLVADNNDTEAGAAEQGDRFWYSRKDLQFFPAGYVLAFWGLLVDDPVTIQKRGPLHGIFLAPLVLR